MSEAVFEKFSEKRMDDMKTVMRGHSPEALALAGVHTFSNGYSASIIPWGHGSTRGLLEGAVMRGRKLDFTTSVTEHIEGSMTAEEARDFFASSLPTRGKKV